ncbi:MAG: sensor histidine kinase [Salibacteraceae bacterium]
MLNIYHASLQKRIAGLLQQELLHRHQLAIQLAVLEGQEAERKKLADDLHDHISALFATSKLYLDMYRKQVSHHIGKEESALQMAMDVIDETAQEVRNLSKQLSSAVLDRLGLIEATEDLCQLRLGYANVRYKIWPFNYNKRLDRRMEQSIYRMISELLRNIKNHAQATRVNIRFSRKDGQLQVAVEDNGVGMPASTPFSSRNGGLASIEAQIGFLNGQMKIESRSQIGTVVTLDIPLPNG